jgi:hypothetical protein
MTRPLLSKPAEPGAPAEVPAVPRRKVRRFWSARRNPAALAALVAVVSAGALLYEEIYVHTGHRAHHWRTWITDQLAQRHLDDSAVITGSALACALGLVLLVLAVTPGLRRVLPLAATGTHALRAGLETGAAEAMLRRAALETSGVHSAKVRVGRRRAKVRAVVGFGDRGEVTAALRERMTVERERLGLSRPPLVNVRLRGKS